MSAPSTRCSVIALPPDLEILTHPAVMLAAGTLFAIEFGADKIPGFDSIWDAFQTFVRIPAGFLLAYGAAGGISPEIAVIAGLLGGTLAAGTHVAKTGSRALINTSPEPFSNIAASLTEDVAVIGGLMLAIAHPITFLCLLAVFVALLVWLLPKLVRLAMIPVRRMAGKSPRA